MTGQYACGTLGRKAVSKGATRGDVLDAWDTFAINGLDYNADDETTVEQYCKQQIRR